VDPLLTSLTTFGVCLLSAVVPFVNAELYLLGASALAPRGLVVPLVVAAALGQMAGKALMYWAGVGALELPGERLRRMVASVKARYPADGTGGAALGGGVILLSASVGLPPFYVVSIACGLLRIPFARFFLLGLVGRLARFGVIVLAPQAVKAWGG
jgi:membrane protein YqaA with SNARE-associated domain